MTTYVDLPDFVNGDIVSASRLNAMARNIDVVIGLDEQRVWPIEAGGDVLNCGIYSRASDARFGGNQATYYMAHNGDRLFFYHVLYGTGGTATLVYNNTTFAGLENSTIHYLSLPSLPRYKIVKIVITPSTENGLFVRQLYGYQSNAAAIGTMPSFTNGTTSSAGDFNTILAGTERAVTQLNQPIAGMYSVDHIGNNQSLALGTNRNGFYGYIRHKHDKLYLELSAWVSDVSDADGYMVLTYNGDEVWKWSPYLTNRFYGGGIYPIDLNPALVVGTWYPIEFRMVFSRDVLQRATLWHLYEYPSGANSTISSMARWEHGDTVNGSSSELPELYEMSVALGAVSTLRWTNPACRAGAQWIPNQSGVCDASSKTVDEFASIRVHRWLAYENIEMADGKRAPVTLLYKTGGGYTFTSAGTLPEVTQPSYYDLDNTPIKPGMYFRLVGSKFLIQTPGYEGE